MKLLTRSILISSLLLLCVLMAGGVYVYRMVSQEIRDEVDEELLNRKLEILASIKANPTAVDFHPALHTDFTIDELTANQYHALTEHFEEINLYELIEGENEPHRQLVSKFTHASKFYALRIQASLLDLEDMAEIIALSTGWVLLSLFAAGFLLNLVLQKRLWRPFYLTLEELSRFRVDQNEPLLIPASSVQEFAELKATVTALAENSQKTYQQQKQFVENASHEIQTPLAIALSQAEQLIQNPELNPADALSIEILTGQLEKLSALNKALLLITKINNQQYGDNQAVNVGELVQKQVEESVLLAERKNITVRCSLESPLLVQANLHLMEILIRNLVRNAFLHNVENGLFEVFLTPDSLQIRNSTLPLEGDPTLLFERFVKQSQSRQSLGLGLSIVKAICESYHFIPTLVVQANRFMVTIQF